MDTTAFPLADVLSITTGRLLSRRHIDGMYTLLGHMTGHDLFTHQLPRAARECAPALLAQHPQLAGVTPPAGVDAFDLMAWLIEQERIYGEMLPVKALPSSTPVDPIEEACNLVGAEKVMLLTNGERPARPNLGATMSGFTASLAIATAAMTAAAAVLHAAAEGES